MKRHQTKFMPVKVLAANLAVLVVGNYAPSLKAAETAKTPVKSNSWQSLMDAGEAAFKLGNYDDAENQFASAACAEQNSGANELHIATSLLRQADACCKEERFETADRLYKRALTIRESKLGPNHSDVMEVLSKQADLELRHRNYLVAEQLYKRILENKEKVSGDNTGTALILKNIAHCKYRRLYDLDPHPPTHRKLPDYVESERLLNRAVAICEKGKINNPDTAKVLDELSRMYWEFQEFPKAEECIRKALAIRDKSLHNQDPSINKNLQDLIGIFTRQDKDEQAKPFYRRLLANWKAEPKETNLDKLNQTIRLNNRGVICLNMNDLKEAENYFLEALRVDPTYKIAIENLQIVRNRMKGH